MDISVIIVNYNTSKLLADCIKSINDKTSNLRYEIIVVDNASSDDSVAEVRRCYPTVLLIENKENLGFGRANNKGAEVAKGKYLFLLNTDTLLINNAINILFLFMEEINNENIGACGGNLYKGDLSPNASYSLYFPSLFSIFCYRAHLSFLLSNETFNISGEIKDVAIIIGADLFIRKKVFDDLGGFDPSFFMYVEDGELSYRIRKSNYRVVSNPEAKIIHLQGSSSSSLFKCKHEISSYFIYFGKHANLYTLIIYWIIELMNAICKLLASVVTFKTSKIKDYFMLVKYILRICYE